MPRTTIVTPTFNRAKLLPATIDSLLSQSDQDFEYIIIDDGSSDDTRSLVARYGRRIRYEYHANRGEAASTNRGWQMATGRYFAMVSSDDPMLPGWLEKTVHVLETRPDVIGVYPDWIVIDDAGQKIGVMDTFDYSLEGMVSWLWTIPGPGTLIRREALVDIEQLRNPSYRYASDLESWLRIGLRGDFVRIPEQLAAWRQHNTSITVADRSLARGKEMIRLAREFFRRRDLPPRVRGLRRFAMSRAYWIAALVVIDTHPLISSYFLRRSYRYSQVDPPNMPAALRRNARPSHAEIGRLLRNSLRQGLRSGG